MEIEERFDYYLGLAKKGVAGFIIFGGELGTVRTGIRELRTLSERPLIIASDLEQGLGQQIEGGTLFPPALAIASAINAGDESDTRPLLGKLFTAIAHETRFAGINTILAPVLDVNTNPKNPIIATRAYGEDPGTVSFIGCSMIETLQREGIMACGKHFPGHGDTEVDSHISLPVIKKDLRSLETLELLPFRRAIDAGVRMIMLGHLCVPAIDPSGIPASLSGKSVAYLRKRMGFKGLVMTDAMNMGAIGDYSEDEASLKALGAGVDLILHPTDPDGAASYLRRKNCMPQPLNIDIPLTQDTGRPDFHEHRRLSDDLTKMAIKIEGKARGEIRKPFLIILNEDREEKASPFLNALRQRYPGIRHVEILPDEEIPWQQIPQNFELIVAVFSRVKAWKEPAKRWLEKAISALGEKAAIFVSFGNPYVLNELQEARPGSRRDITKVYVFWGSETAQTAAAERLSFI